MQARSALGDGLVGTDHAQRNELHSPLDDRSLVEPAAEHQLRVVLHRAEVADVDAVAEPNVLVDRHPVADDRVVTDAGTVADQDVVTDGDVQTELYRCVDVDTLADGGAPRYEAR